MTTALQMAFQIFASAAQAMSATDIQVRLPMAVENPRKLTSELESRGLIAEAYRVRQEKFFAVVPGAVAPVDGRAANAIAASAKALLVRRKHRFAMLAREARRRGRR